MAPLCYDQDPEPVDDDVAMQYKNGDNAEIYVNQTDWTEAYLKDDIDIQKKVAIIMLIVVAIIWAVLEIIRLIVLKIALSQSKDTTY